MESVELEKTIIGIIGSTGRIVKRYCECKIEILDPANFPWYEVIEILTSVGHDIRIVRRNDTLLLIFELEPIY